ncbi:MAG: cation transporter [Clostridiales bacterium]|jgi:Cd2+/Zn2+-exporting ATPase|nr:cation transporter [Clostridiales bacterium]
MTKNLKIENIDCPNCAAKVEKKISDINGVKSCSLNFFTGKLSIEAEEAEMDGIIQTAAKAVKKYASGATLKVN